MSMAEGEGTRRGGRAARRAKRVNAPVFHKPTLNRNIPVYEVIDEEGVELMLATVAVANVASSLAALMTRACSGSRAPRGA